MSSLAVAPAPSAPPLGPDRPGLSLPAGWTLAAYDSIDSTNAEARRRAEAGAPHGTVVQARVQSAGRGRYRRPWVSEAGNLYCSVVLRPDCTAALAGQLSFIVALAAAAAVEELAPACRVQLKWPNDLLLHRRKFAGILLESSLDGDGRASWVVAGLGVNLVSHPSEALVAATDLAAAGGGDLAADALAERFLDKLNRLEGEWRRSGFSGMHKAWLARAVGIGEAVTVRSARRQFSGRFEGLDADGSLILRRDEGAVEIVTAGDVFFGDPPCS